jgi:mono/diheme cytochrome c family protein
MPAFGRAYSEADLRDVAAYIVEVLAKQPAHAALQERDRRIAELKAELGAALRQRCT